MAPMLLDHSEDEEIISKTIAICSDPSVVVSDSASRKTKELWWLHGHPHSKRYSNPALNSLSALIRHNGVAFKGQKDFLYPLSTEPTTQYGTMTWDEFDKITESLALSYATYLKKELEDSSIKCKQPTIALLGGGRTVEYFCTQLALQKLGIRVLLLAESNAQSALHHLLETCNALAVITDSKASSVDTNGIRKIAMIEALPKCPQTKISEVDAVKFRDFEDIWEQHTFIIHSSGSTGMPKPIIHTNRSMMLIARMYRLFQEFEVDNWFLLFPLYHIAGISIALSNLPNGKILSFPPLAWPPSSSTIFSAWKTLSEMGHPVDITHCAPTIIENMYDYITSTTHDWSPLTSLKVLQPGGAALSEIIVKALVSAGVNVKTTYGSTETGPPMRTIPHSRSNPKCYTFRNLYPDSPFLKMELVGEGLYECVIYKGFELAAELWDGKPSNEPYRTNDLFIQDPPGSGNYLLQGRRDDILVHSNGENTSAGPLQLDIQTSSKYIARALALGHSRPCVALLVELHEEYDTGDEEHQAAVWEAVQKVNARYPKHSQITRSMIHILPSGSNLPVTPKGNVMRKEAERIYASAIFTLFEDDAPQLTDITANGTSQQLLSNFLRTQVASLSNTSATQINDWTTFYDLGIDSRLALSLRSAISKHLCRPVSLGSIFENPSIAQLVSFLSSTPENTLSTPTKPTSTETVNRIFARLSFELKSWPSRSTTTYAPVEKHTVLLTGASGSLGTALLQTLSASPSVAKIYALTRGPSHVAKLEKALRDRGLDASIVGEGRKVTVLNFSMQDPLLGLGIEEYAVLAREVTVVVANAWVLDFNRGVEEFEGDCLRNTMSLLRLCLAGRPKMMAFTSSVSTCMGPGYTRATVAEEPLGEDPTVALSTGYALSKYIAERILHLASTLPHLLIPTTLLRVGQLCGSTSTYHWSSKEMWPIMFASSFHPQMSCIPSLSSKIVDWVPVDVAASTIHRLLTTTTPISGEGIGGGYEVFNIVNPNPISWGELVGMLQTTYLTHRTQVSCSSSSVAKMELEVVPMTTWVSRLTTLSETGISADEIPGLKLLQFFANMAHDNEPSKVFEVSKTVAASKALRECSSFCKEWVVGNMRIWREGGVMVSGNRE